MQKRGRWRSSLGWLRSKVLDRTLHRCDTSDFEYTVGLRSICRWADRSLDPDAQGVCNLHVRHP